MATPTQLVRLINKALIVEISPIALIVQFSTDESVD